MQKSREILERYWGYSQFRPFQEEIADAAIYGKDVLALLPTGGGKSICFQVPGLAREGVTIVVSPLIALMEDQVQQLKKRGIRAIALTSGMTYREMDFALDNARFGGIDFIYVSPERIQTDLFRERVKRMNVGLFVVDEAHCISEWGHDFRPAYQQISLMREWHPNVPMIALTATATSKVMEDIVASLELKQVNTFVAPFERNNLSYEIIHVPNKRSAIQTVCNLHKHEVGIVYCQTRRSVKDMTQFLFHQGLKVSMYHGGMQRKERSLALNNWLNETTPIMVATNAFGMGIDKPNVRFVIHYELPNNPEAYFQEAGRAGRDGNRARTYAFVEPNDTDLLLESVNKQFPEIDLIKQTYRALCSFLKIAIGSGTDETYSVDLVQFCKRFQFNLSTTFLVLKILELNNTIAFREEGLTGSRVKFAIDNAHLYGFQLKNPALDPLITNLSRMHSNIFEQFAELDEELLCARLKIKSDELNVQLKKLEEHGIIDINWRTNLPTVTFLHERLPNDYLELRPEVYFFRKERAVERAKKMIELVDGQHCRQAFVLNYFGQNSKPCGKCDYCKSQSAGSIKEKLENLLQEKQNMSQLLSHFEPHEMIQVKSLMRMWLVEEKLNFDQQCYWLKP